MEKSISVFCGDKYLRQKIYLILSQSYDVQCADVFAAPTRSALGADLVIWNINDAPLPDGVRARTVTLGDGGDVPLPFTEKMLLSAIERSGSEKSSAPLVLGEKCAYFYGKIIHFTDVEFSLLSALAAAGGEFIAREQLIATVWGDGTTEGILNVYVHYLREKLEFRGEKIIISSRKMGYKIDKKYLTAGGEE